MTPRNRLIFDHIPKTAGVSIVTALSDVFGEGGALAPYISPHHIAITSAGSRRFLAGHLWFHPKESLAEGWYYATLLREPVDCFLSQYFFSRSLAKLYGNHMLLNDPQVLAARRCPLEEYLKLDAQNIKRSYTNVQAAHFAQRLCHDPYALPDMELFETAVGSLEEYDLAGIFDNLPEFVEVICHEFGLPPASLPSLNFNPQRLRVNEISLEMIQHLREANRVDLKLFEWAKQRFSARRQGIKAREGSAAEAAKPVSIVRTQTDSNDAPTRRELSAPVNFGTREIEIISAACAGEGSGVSVVLSGEAIRITMMCLAKTEEPDLTIGVAIRDSNGLLVYGTNSRQLGTQLSIPRPQRFTTEFLLRANLGIGEYAVTLALHKGASHSEGCYHWMDKATGFRVVGYKGCSFEGLVNLGARLDGPIVGNAAHGDTK